LRQKQDKDHFQTANFQQKSKTIKAKNGKGMATENVMSFLFVDYMRMPYFALFRRVDIVVFSL